MKQLVTFLVVFTSLLEIEAQQAQDINPVLKCEGCIAVVSEVNKILVRPSKQNIQSRVADSLQRLCEIDNLRTYKFSPPKMVKACNYLLQNHKQDLLSTFIENYADITSLDFDTLLDDICWTRTKLCHGFTKKAEEKKEADILLNQDTEQVLLRQEGDLYVLETSTDENNPDSNPDPLVEEEVDPLADEVEETISKPKEVKEKTKVKKTKIVEKQTTQDKQGKNQKQDKNTKQKDVQKEKKVKAKEPQENQEADIKVEESKGKQDIKSPKEKTKSNKNKNEETNKQNQDGKIKKQKQLKQEPTQEQEASTINKEEIQTQEKQSKNKNKEKPLKSKPKEQVEKNKNKQDQENLKSKNKDKLGKEQKGKKGGKTAKEEL